MNPVAFSPSTTQAWDVSMTTRPSLRTRWAAGTKRPSHSSQASRVGAMVPAPGYGPDGPRPRRHAAYRPHPTRRPIPSATTPFGEDDRPADGADPAHGSPELATSGHDPSISRPNACWPVRPERRLSRQRSHREEPEAFSGTANTSALRGCQSDPGRSHGGFDAHCLEPWESQVIHHGDYPMRSRQRDRRPRFVGWDPSKARRAVAMTESGREPRAMGAPCRTPRRRCVNCSPS